MSATWPVRPLFAILLGGLLAAACGDNPRHFGSASGGASNAGASGTEGGRSNTRGGVAGQVGLSGGASAAHASGGASSGTGGANHGDAGSTIGGMSDAGAGGELSGGASGATGGVTNSGGQRASGGASTTDASSGLHSGGASTGGASTGGGSSGGASTAGNNTGGKSSGGTNTGGVATGGTTTGGKSSGGTNTGGVSTGGTITGGAPNCASGLEIACNNRCVAPDSDAKNCGRCGHDCGVKAGCSSGQCLPATLVSALPSALGLDVSADGIFYTTDNTVQRCTLASACVGGPTQVGLFPLATKVAVTKTLATNWIAVYGQASIGPSYSYLYCPITGCTTPVPTFASLDFRRGTLSGLIGFQDDFYFQSTGPSGIVESAVNRVVGSAAPALGMPLTIAAQVASQSLIAVDTANVYFARTDANGEAPAIVRCDRLSSCSAPLALLGAVPKAIAAYAGKFYWTPHTPDYVRRCDVNNCASTTEALQYVASEVDEIVVDASGIFWLTPTTIAYCPLTGCAGGAKTLVSGLSGASSLRAQGDFVYWLVASTVDAPNGGIYRVAKP